MVIDTNSPCSCTCSWDFPDCSLGPQPPCLRIRKLPQQDFKSLLCQCLQRKLEIPFPGVSSPAPGSGHTQEDGFSACSPKLDASRQPLKEQGRQAWSAGAGPLCCLLTQELSPIPAPHLKSLLSPSSGLVLFSSVALSTNSLHQLDTYVLPAGMYVLKGCGLHLFGILNTCTWPAPGCCPAHTY